MEVSELITVTGSTGYVGGRLVPELLQNGYRVRCVTRSAESLQDRDWTDQVEIVEEFPLLVLNAFNNASVHLLSSSKFSIPKKSKLFFILSWTIF